MSEQQTTEFGKLIKRLDELESTIERQDKRHKVLVERHDNLVRKTHTEPDHSFLDDETIMHIDPMVNPAAGMTMSGDLDLPPFQREVFDRLHRLEIHNALEGEQKVTFTGHLESLEETVDEHYRINQARIDNINDRVVELESTVENNIFGRLDYHRDRIDAVTKAVEQYDDVESTEEISDLSLQVEFARKFNSNKIDSMSLRLDNIINAFGNEVKRINRDTEDNSKDIQDILNKTVNNIPTNAGNAEGLYHDSLYIDPPADLFRNFDKRVIDTAEDLQVDSPYYERLAFNLAGNIWGNTDVENELMLALRNMREEDVAILMKYCKNIALHHSPEAFITE